MNIHPLVAALALAMLTGVALHCEAQTPAAVAPSAAAPAAAPAAPSGSEVGLAAVYSDKLAGNLTASGKKYDPDKLTAAHKTLSFGTRVKVTNQKNGKSVELRITDRGPKQPDRILDISRRAAKALGISRYAMANVTMEVIN